MKNAQKTNWCTLIMIKCAAIVLVIVMSAFLHFALTSIPMRSVISLIHHGDIIYYYRMSAAMVGGIPVLLYCIFIGLRGLFYPGIRSPDKTTIIDDIFIPFWFYTFAISLVISFMIPFWLLFAGYSSCHDRNLIGYYTTNPELCKTIVRPKFLSWPFDMRESGDVTSH